MGRYDWERRYLLMRTHMAVHILCGAVWRDDGAQVTGGNMNPGEGRVDYKSKGAINKRIDVEPG